MVDGKLGTRPNYAEAVGVPCEVYVGRRRCYIGPVGYALPGIRPPARGGLPRPGCSSKSGLEFSIASLRFTGRLGIRGGGPGGGFHRGLTPLCEMEVKVDRSDSAGLRDPCGISSSYAVLVWIGGGGVGLGLGLGLGAAKRGSTSS